MGKFKLKIICNVNQERIDDIECYKFDSISKEHIYNFVNKIIRGNRGRDVIEITNALTLYAFNNCLMRFIVKDNLDDELDEEVIKVPALNPDDVEIYDLIDGKLVDIKNEYGTVGENQFNEQMNVIMNDYYNLLNYFNG